MRKRSEKEANIAYNDTQITRKRREKDAQMIEQRSKNQ
jgi:hypothetical protein